MPWVDDLLSYVTHPQVLPHLVAAFRPATPPDYGELHERLKALELRVDERGGKRGRPRKETPPSATMGAGPSLTQWRDTAIRASGTLKEALRFVREDGVQHPEAQQRIRDVQAALADLPALERFDLAPERLQTLPPAERQAWEAMLPTIRGLRQTALNRLTTPEGVADAAALAGTWASQLQQAVSGHIPTAAAPTPPATAYSRYAPDMSIGTGCIPCTRAHVQGVTAVLEKAVDAAQTGPWTDPAIQDRLAFAQEELAALFAYDVTPDKIAATPEPERTTIQQALPALQQAWHQIQTATGPQDVATALTTLRAVQAQLQADPPTGESAWTHLTPTRPVRPPVGDPRPRRVREWTDVNPTPGFVGQLTLPTDTATAYDRLTAALAARGVPVRVRQLPVTGQYILEGEYDPFKNRVLLNPSVLTKDSYSLQTLIHESAHALLHNTTCLPNQAVDHRPYEDQAEAVTLAVMLQSGLPVELRDGELLPPGARQINWDAMKADLGPDGFTNAQWAAQWILQAIQTGHPPDLVATCPIPMTGGE